MNDEKTLIYKKDGTSPIIDEQNEKTAILRHKPEVSYENKAAENNTVIMGNKMSFVQNEDVEEKIHRMDFTIQEKKTNEDKEPTKIAEQVDSFIPANNSRTEIVREEKNEPIKFEKSEHGQTRTRVQVKKMFRPQELNKFTEQAYYLRPKQPKLTEEKTDIFIPKESHLDDNDEVSVGYLIDNKYELTALITKKSGEAAIYKCQVRGLTGTYVAKIYYPNIQPKEDIMEKILINLNSENVVKLNMIGFILTRTGRRLYEIMPFYTKGNLEMRMPLSEEELTKKIVPSINEGLRAIHRINIIHRDLKPNNLFIEEVGNDDSKIPGYKLQANEKIVIGDFGISSQIKDGATHRITSASRTRGYGAPETITENITTPKSDYFAFGITLLTLLSGEYPYHDEIEMILKIKDNIWNFPPSISPRMRQLITGLMTYDRSKRWGYDEVLDWINDKVVQVKNNPESKFSRSRINEGYEFKFKRYYDVVSLTEALIQDWDFAIQHIQNRFIENSFMGSSKEFDSLVQDMDRLRHIGAGNDKVFLMLIYNVLQSEGIIYHGLNFKNLEDMSEYILTSNEVDEKIIDLIRSKNLNYIIRLISKYSNRFNNLNKINDVLDEIEIIQRSDKRLAYYLLGYVFNRDRKKIDIAKLEIFPNKYATHVASLEDVYQAYKNAENRQTFADDIMTNTRFKAWLYYMGYSQDKSFMNQ